MSSISLQLSLTLIVSICLMIEAQPLLYPSITSSLLVPSYSSRLNSYGRLGLYHSNSHSPIGFGHLDGGYGSRLGQGFVGNPGIGIRQSSATLANVYAPRLASTSFGLNYGSLMMLPSPYNAHQSSSLLFPSQYAYSG
ncbi:hypothetical protein QR98_0092870 [Sarcoptes scabiei]|uniref:Uncharacterized protein n=1 Tax=Sarcoptes scabiei TaxID=52283 RepID=A0A132AIA2_SARSC|nr:hypothetical protein QR98_0092870 [Sarcoptes scabiei]